MSCIAVHETKGIYLGINAGHAVFSIMDVPITSKAIRFNSEEDVDLFFKSALPNIADAIKAVNIHTTQTGNHVDVVDIFKSGYYNYTDSMFQAMPVYSLTKH